MEEIVGLTFEEHYVSIFQGGREMNLLDLRLSRYAPYGGKLPRVKRFLR